MEIPEQHLDSFEKEGYFIWEGFLDIQTLKDIVAELIDLTTKETFRKAGIGKDNDFQINESQRGDFIHWINPAEGASATKIYLEKIEELITYLNRTFYLGIRDFECHYTHYPAGSFYKKHVDRHKNGSHRIVSFVLYLNEDWNESDGGLLRLYNNTDHFVDVLPRLGTLAVFLSEKEHEVQLTQRIRMSITGWMLNEKAL